ncbi:hypothetical protein BDW71DRAFT_187351 [Aspergillus fruticulosus]
MRWRSRRIQAVSTEYSVVYYCISVLVSVVNLSPAATDGNGQTGSADDGTGSIYSVLHTLTVADGDPCIEEIPNFVPCPDRHPWHGSCHAQRPSSASQVPRIKGWYLSFEIEDLPDISI